MDIVEEMCPTAAGEGWPSGSLTMLAEYMKDQRLEARYLGWGYHFPSKGLLIYRNTTLRQIYNAFEWPPMRVPTVAFCDGSGTTGDKTAGIGVALYQAGEHPVYIAENIGKGTNNVAELRAIWRALQAFPDLGRKLMIRSDSEYAIGSLTKSWSATANAELIANIRKDLSLRGDRVRFDHVDGHAGIEGNEVADRLANIGRKVVKQISL